MKTGISNAGLKRIATARQKKATQDSAIWEMVDLCKESLGEAGLIDSLIQAMSTEEARENLEFVMQVNDMASGGGMHLHDMDSTDEYE